MAYSTPVSKGSKHCESWITPAVVMAFFIKPSSFTIKMHFIAIGGFLFAITALFDVVTSFGMLG